MEVTPFPYCIVRLGAAPFEDLSSLNFQYSTIKQIGNYANNFDLLTTKKNNLSILLLDFIQTITDSHDQNIVQNYRRDFYNNRKQKDKNNKRFLELVPENIKKEIKDYDDLLSKTTNVKSELDILYESEVKRIRNLIKEMSNKFYLLNGLQFSSLTFYESLQKYLKDSSEEFGKNEKRIEESLIKYLGRIHAKTSPFSSFTNIGLGSIEKFESSDYLYTKLDRLKVNSSLRLNIVLFRTFKDLLRCSSVALNLYVRFNSTLKSTANEVRFLVNSQNIESFQSITSNDLVTALINYFQQNSELKITKGELMNIILEEYDVEPGELITLIDELLDLGMLEYDFGISGLDPEWDVKLQSELSRFNSIEAQKISNGLIQLREIIKDFELGDLSQRIFLINRGFELVQNIYDLMYDSSNLGADKKSIGIESHIKAMREKMDNVLNEVNPFKYSGTTFLNLKKETIFFEDTFVTPKIQINASKINPFLYDVDRLIRSCYSFDLLARSRQSILNFFLEKYKPNSKVDLLDFYEELKRKELQDAANESVKVQHENETNKKWSSLFSATLEDIAIGSESIDISLETLEKINQSFPQEQSNQNVQSNGIAVQLFVNELTQVSGVIQGVFPGYGKMLSRFLYGFSPDIAEEIRKWNLRYQGNFIFAENIDNSHFNANIHPPLLQYEIKMPGGCTSLADDQQIDVKDLQVEHDGIENKLFLFWKKKESRVKVLDLGFQAGLGRAKLFMLLQLFNDTNIVTFSHIVTPINKLFEERSKMPLKFKPRIVINNRIVIQRKTWTIPAELSSLFNKQGTELDNYLCLKNWQKENILPDQVYFRIATSDQYQNNKPRDYYKPQYLNFNSPILSSYFIKAIGKLTEQETLSISEMLPGKEDMIKIGDSHFVNEHLIQWYHTSN